VRFLQTHPVTGVRIIGALSAELASARRKARDLALKNAESRLASLILQLAKAEDALLTPGQRLHLRFTRRELADMLAVSTETAIRLLSKLQRKKVISVTGREVVVINPETLGKLANYTEAEA